MGVYKRKLKKGIRFYYRGQYFGQRYHSEAIYMTKQECKRAESLKIKELDELKRNPVQDMFLADFLNERLDYIKLKFSQSLNDNQQKLFDFVDEAGCRINEGIATQPI